MPSGQFIISAHAVILEDYLNRNENGKTCLHHLIARWIDVKDISSDRLELLGQWKR